MQPILEAKPQPFEAVEGESAHAGDRLGPLGSESERFEWKSRRNCSLAPRQLAVLLSIPAFVSVGIGLYFVMIGTWWMLFFATIEVLALVAAFVVYARHAGAYERVLMTPERLLVEFNSGSRVFQEEMRPDWTRIVFPCARITGFRESPLVELQAAGRSLSLGRFISPSQRAALAGDLRARLRRLQACKFEPVPVRRANGEVGEGMSGE